jgi:3-isopropylmalate/(R)-2-methylmalate dehydratase large subunit
MTITEKLLAHASGRDSVRAGEFVSAKLSVVLANDITAPIAIREFKKMGAKQVFDRTKIALVADHSTPNKDIAAAEQVKTMRDFAREQGIVHYYETAAGIEHILLPDRGLVLPGDCVIGADSHTCTYGTITAFSTGVGSTDCAAGLATGECWFRVPETLKFVFQGTLRPWVGGKDLILYTIGQIGVDGALYQAMEFHGSAIRSLGMAGRFTMCNMAIEAGGKNGIVPFDEVTKAYVDQRASRPYTVFDADEDAEYAAVYEWDATGIEPQVAAPFLPSNTKGVSEFRNVSIDQAVVGACTNGRIEDLRQAAEVLRGRKVAPGVRCIVIPGTHEIHLQATREGLVELFLEAGAAVSTPTCGPCLGGHMGVLASGERAIATTNRNFVGRMGHPKSEVYLASPAVAAASAVCGRICGPDEL